MSVLWLSLDVALGDILAFGFALMIIIGGFAFSAQYVYGSFNDDFNTFFKSYISMFRALIDDINVEKISHVAPIFTVVLYITWSLLTKVIALNMFIAIVTRAFDNVSDDSKESDGNMTFRVQYSYIQVLSSGKVQMLAKKASLLQEQAVH